MSGLLGRNQQRGSWLANVLIAIAVALVVAVSVVVTLVIIDRYSSTEIRISGHTLAPPVVDISGAVATPGVYDLPADARLVDAVGAAGGLTRNADRSQLNLAARVGDGERIVIPAMPDAPGQAASGTPELPSSVGSININRASPAQLELLPGIGPVLAARIVDEREREGPFLSVDDLTRVDGISESTVEALRPLVNVDG